MVVHVDPPDAKSPKRGDGPVVYGKFTALITKAYKPSDIVPIIIVRSAGSRGTSRLNRNALGRYWAR